MSEIVNPSGGGGGSGTVTTVSVVTANGFSGTVANPTTTPAITLNAGTPPTSWTPTDQSGAGLTFTAVSAQYTVIGNMVFAYGTLTYPATADGTNSKISLPVAVPNQAYAVVAGMSGSSVALGIEIRTLQNSSTAQFTNTAGVVATNANLTGASFHFMLIYPAS